MASIKLFFLSFVLLIAVPTVFSQLGAFFAQKDIESKFEEAIPNWKEKTEILNQIQQNRDFSDEFEIGSDRSWQLKQVQKYLDNMFEEILESSANATDGLYEGVEPTCEAHARYTLQQFWALNKFSLHLVDSWGKLLTSGILSGHLQVPGDFRECVQARGHFPGSDEVPSGEMRGKYCNTYLFPGEALFNSLIPSNDSDYGNDTIGIQESVDIPELLGELLRFSLPIFLPQIGTCFPSSCSTEDVTNILNNYHRIYMFNVTSPIVLGCQVEEKEPFDAKDYSVIVLLLIIVAICAAGTTVDVFLDATTKKTGGLGMKSLLAFSVYTNSKKWMNTNQGTDNLGCINGLRTLSMAWVVLCHSYIMVMTAPLWNIIDARRVYKHWSLFPIINGTPSVDTFFTMGGVLVAYNLLRELDKRKGQFNYFLYALHRFLRITPTYIILVGIMATILPYFGSGPNWTNLESESRACSKNWWHNILYVNNLVKYTLESAPCYGEAWYLANDMQFFLLSPIVVYPMWKWKGVGLSFLAFLNVASMIIPAVITHVKDLPPGSVYFIDMKTYATDIYSKPWARYGPYAVGIVCGYILYERKKNGNNLKLPWWFIGLGWVLCTAGALGVIFGPFKYFQPENAEYTYGTWHALLYAGTHRWVWGLCISWIIFACVSGYGGIVNSILSMKLFVPLGRLTFCMYITSYHIQMIYHFGQTHPSDFTSFNAVYIFFAHLLVSGIVAYVLTMALESPFIQLEKIIFAPFAGPPKKEPTLPINTGDLDTKELKLKDPSVTA